MAVVMMLAAALAGVLSRRSPVPGTVIIAVFGLLGAFAVYRRPDLTTVALLAPIASVVSGIAVSLLLHRIAPRVWREPDTGEKPVRPGGRFCSAGPVSWSARARRDWAAG